MLKIFEIKDFIISVIILGFVFGFDDGREAFQLTPWLINFIKICLLSTIALLIHHLSQRIIAKKFGCQTEHEIWRVKQYGFSSKSHFPITLHLGFTRFILNSFPLGILLPILVTFLSNGQLFFAATGVCLISVNKAYRIGKKYTRLTNYETAKITLSGPLANILFAIILKIFSGFNPMFDQLILINSMLAISNMIPFPHLDGGSIYFGSRPLFVFSFVFILGCVILLQYLSIISTLFLSLLIAIILVIAYFYFKMVKS